MNEHPSSTKQIVTEKRFHICQNEILTPPVLIHNKGKKSQMVTGK